jgi:hypothetical protein
MMLSALKEHLRQRLATDAAIDAFCQTQFGRALTVVKRFDVHNPPGKDACPWAHLEFLGDRKSNVSREVPRTFMLSCGVWRDPDGNQDDGEDRAGDLRELIEAALMLPGLGKVETGEDVHEIGEDGFFENVSTIIVTNK